MTPDDQSNTRLESAKPAQGPDLLAVALLGAMTALALVAVFFRYVLNDSLVWSDEVLRYLLVWAVFIGAALAVRDRDHIRVSYFVDLLPAGPRRLMERIASSAIFAANLIFVITGTVWVFQSAGTLTSSLQWPLNITHYAALPVSGLLGLWFGWRQMLRRNVGTESSSPTA